MAIVAGDASEIFPIADASLYGCRVWEFTKGHSVLKLAFEPYTNDTFAPSLLMFQNVHYFAGPMRWHGVDFVVSPRDECFQLMCKINRTFQEFTAELFDAYGCRLYTISRPDLEVKIIAHRNLEIFDWVDYMELFQKSKES
jgi:hypothetical protein